MISKLSKLEFLRQQLFLETLTLLHSRCTLKKPTIKCLSSEGCTQLLHAHAPKNRKRSLRSNPSCSTKQTPWWFSSGVTSDFVLFKFYWKRVCFLSAVSWAAVEVDKGAPRSGGTFSYVCANLLQSDGGSMWKPASQLHTTVFLQLHYVRLCWFSFERQQQPAAHKQGVFCHQTKPQRGKFVKGWVLEFALQT